jgi:hypothetical protein
MVCKPPKCKYNFLKKKCVKPNPYFEALAWCKRNSISNEKCKEDYYKNKQRAISEACNRMKEKDEYIKPKKSCPEGKIINPKTGRCVKIKFEKKCPEGKVKNPLTGRCVKKRTVKRIKSLKPDSFNVPKIASFKKLSNTSSFKHSISNKSRSVKLLKYIDTKSSNKSSQFSKVVKNPYIEKKTAKFFPKKTKKENPPINISDIKIKVKKETVAKKPRTLKLKYHHVVIKDLFEDKSRMSTKKSSIKPESLKSTSFDRKVADLKHKINARKIKEFLKSNLLKKYFTLNRRVKYYLYVKKFLKNISKKTCLEPKVFIDKYNRRYNGYTINDIINLEKKIGTESVYGVIYKTSIKNMLGTYPIATKLTPIGRDNLKEIKINKLISKNILKNKISKHFLFTYKVIECENKHYNLPNNIKNKKYYITLNELANGDLASLCKDLNFLKDDNLVLNVAIQCFLSIATFHKIGYLHHDCHYGNFLYHIVEDKSGYYHYVINGNNYYLKNCGINILIYDFGFAQKYTIEEQKRLKIENVRRDYLDINRSFMNKSIKGWSEFDKYPTDRISEFFKIDVSKTIETLTALGRSEDILIKELLELYIKGPSNTIFFDKLPSGEKIINETPYIIDNSIKIN